jgi:hypothetical protein
LQSSAAFVGPKAKKFAFYCFAIPFSPPLRKVSIHHPCKHGRFLDKGSNRGPVRHETARKPGGQGLSKGSLQVIHMEAPVSDCKQFLGALRNK